MDTRKSLHRLVPSLALVMTLASLMIQPAPAGAQCSVNSTSVIPGTGGSPYNKVYKRLNGIYACMSVMNMNVSLCNPMATFATMTLIANANTTYVSPTCSFTCTGGCGTITITSVDGLPVELMEFEIDDGESSESADEDES